MTATYITRNTSEYDDVLKRAEEKDLLKRAGMLSECWTPDELFNGHKIKRDQAFGILVLFKDSKTLESIMKEKNNCTTLSDLHNLIDALSAYPIEDQHFYEEKRQAFLTAQREYEELKKTVNDSSKELHRLETAVKNAGKQKEWLEKENSARTRKIENLSREIKDYEAAIEDFNGAKGDTEERLKELASQRKPLEEDLVREELKASTLQKKEKELRDSITFATKVFHPVLAKETEQEADLTNAEYGSLKSEIQGKTEKLKELKKEIERLENGSNMSSEDYERIQNSLNNSLHGKETAQTELTGGIKMIERLNEQVEALEQRIAVIGKEGISSSEEYENAYIALLARSEELVHAWISSSSKLKEILKAEVEIKPDELVEALFFCLGTMCGSGTTACNYLEQSNAELNTLLLYNTDEERPGFWHVETFTA